MYKKNKKLAEVYPEKPEKVIVFGDIHGDLEALKAGLDKAGPKDLVIFLGDYADRGPFGVEVIETVKKLITEESDRYIALKGNHEDYTEHGNPVFSPCTLVGEAEQKRGSWAEWFPLFRGFVHELYIAAVIPGFALFVHGGISSDLRSPGRLSTPGAELEQNILWSDPGSGKGESPNPRGAGLIFGVDVTKQVTEDLGVEYIIRSHEPRKAMGGPAIEHAGRFVTVNSTAVYGGAPFVMVFDMAELPSTEEEMRKAAVML